MSPPFETILYDAFSDTFCSGIVMGGGWLGPQDPMGCGRLVSYACFISPGSRQSQCTVSLSGIGRPVGCRGLLVSGLIICKLVNGSESLVMVCRVCM